MKKSLLGIFVLLTSIAHAQQEGNAFTTTGRAVATTFVTDYEAASINPANQAWGTGEDGKRVAFGLGEVSFSAYTDAITKEKFSQTLNGNLGDFTVEQKAQAAAEFSNNGMAVNVDVSLFSFYLHVDKIGGFSVGVKDRAQYYTKFNSTTSDLLFNGYYSSYFDSVVVNGNKIPNDPNHPQYDRDNIEKGIAEVPLSLAEIFNGTEVNVAYTREYDISFGRYIISNELIKLGAGISLKWVHGFAAMKLNSDGDNLEAFVSTSPDYDIDYGDAKLSNPSATNDGTGSKAFPRRVGEGFGADIGFNVVLFNKLKIGTAINEIGSIKWTGNVYELNDTLLKEFNSDGFDSYNVPAEMNEVFDLDGIIKWKGQQSYKTKLPTTWRFGVSYELLEGKAHAGLDLVVPLNDAPGNFANPIYAIGGDISPFTWFQFQTGLSYGGNTSTSLNIPIGIKFRVGERGTWEVGFASRDFITWFSQNTPHLSGSMGFLRFRF